MVERNVMFSKKAFGSCFTFSYCSEEDAIGAFAAKDCNSDLVPPFAATSPDPRPDSFVFQHKTNLRKIDGLLS
ncbi:MAG: hypothetical protein EZS28_036180, partial [Streblomastix strix]